MAARTIVQTHPSLTHSVHVAGMLSKQPSSGSFRPSDVKWDSLQELGKEGAQEVLPNQSDRQCMCDGDRGIQSQEGGGVRGVGLVVEVCRGEPDRTG